MLARNVSSALVETRPVEALLANLRELKRQRLPFFRGPDRHRAIAVVQHALAEAYRAAPLTPHQARQSLLWFRRAAASYRAAKDLLSVADVWMALGDLAQSTSAAGASEAMRCYAKALRIFRHEGDLHDLAAAYRARARVLLRSGKSAKRALAELQRLRDDLPPRSALLSTLAREIEHLENALEKQATRKIKAPRPTTGKRPAAEPPPTYALPPRPASDVHFAAANPATDSARSLSLPMRGAFNWSLYIHEIGPSKIGFEAQNRLLVAFNNAMYATEPEQRLAALESAQKCAIEAFDDQSAAPAALVTIREYYDLLLGALGEAHLARRSGDPVHNREQSIAFYKKALDLQTARGDLRLALRTRLGLAHALVSGAQTEGRTALQSALTLVADVVDLASPIVEFDVWLQCREQFARIVAQSADFLNDDAMIERAIALLSAASRDVDAVGDQEFLATAHRALGALYVKRRRGEARLNTERAVFHLRRALKSSESMQAPDLWALNVYNLHLAEMGLERQSGVRVVDVSALRAARSELIARGRPLLAAAMTTEQARHEIRQAQAGQTADLEGAIRDLESALETYAERNEIAEQVQTLHLMHLCEFGLQRTREAAWRGLQALKLSHYIDAHALDLQQTRAVTEDMGALSVRTAGLFVLFGEGAAALQALELGRSRTLRSALELAKAADQESAHIRALLAEIRGLEARLADQDRHNIGLLEQLGQLRQTARGAIDQVLSSQTSSTAWAEAEELTKTYSAIVYPVISDASAFLLILCRKQDDLRALVVALGDDPASLISTWRKWQASEPADPHAALEELKSALWDFVGGPLLKILHDHGIQEHSRIAIVPHGELALVPVPLAGPAGHDFCLGDMYEFSLAPTLHALKEPASDDAPFTLALVLDPNDDLPFTQFEAATLPTLFSASSALVGRQCTRDNVLSALKGKSHWLFSAHNRPDQSDMRRSGLLMANGEALSVSDFFAAQGLGAPRLVGLAACTSAAHIIGRGADEFLGLPTAFLNLGADAVLASLWPVDDASTSYLMAWFFFFHVQQRERPAKALRSAQSWVRRAKVSDLRGMVETFSDLSQAPDLMKKLTERFDGLPDEATPFSHPYFWAGFVLYGA